jgi:hypothetical protein
MQIKHKRKYDRLEIRLLIKRALSSERKEQSIASRALPPSSELTGNRFAIPRKKFKKVKNKSSLEKCVDNKGAQIRQAVMFAMLPDNIISASFL